jgi:hypothetical protein
LLDLARFGQIWLNLESAWIFLGFYALHIPATDLILNSTPAGRRPAQPMLHNNRV